MPYSEAASLCGGDLPPYIAKDSTPRVVVMVDGTTGCPCGGTHVADVGEIGAMKARWRTVHVLLRHSGERLLLCAFSRRGPTLCASLGAAAACRLLGFE